MIDENYKPQPGRVEVDETFVTDFFGQQHLNHLRISIQVRLPHASAMAIKRRYPHAQLMYITDEHGESAEVEILLRLSDGDVWPYLEWRDSMLARVYQEAEIARAH